MTTAKTSAKPLSKLKMAFPKGCEIKGLTALNGFVCVDVKDKLWADPKVKNLIVSRTESDQSNYNVDEFLPLVSYSDYTNWSLLLNHAARLYTDTEEQADHCSWILTYSESVVAKNDAWALIGQSAGSYPYGPSFVFPSIEETDIEDALLSIIIKGQTHDKTRKAKWAKLKT